MDDATHSAPLPTKLTPPHSPIIPPHKTTPLKFKSSITGNKFKSPELDPKLSEDRKKRLCKIGEELDGCWLGPISGEEFRSKYLPGGTPAEFPDSIIKTFMGFIKLQ